MISPSTPGSGYVLLHHVMGELEGVRHAWGYPEGGMGAVSAAIARQRYSQAFLSVHYTGFILLMSALIGHNI